MENEEYVRCEACDYGELESCGDGFYYCLRCGVRVEDMVETRVNADEEYFIEGGIYTPRLCHRVSQSESLHHSQLLNISKQEHIQIQPDEVKLTLPKDFGSSSSGLSYQDYYTQVRMRYVMGVQYMIELQCQDLVDKFGVTPLICGMTGVIWMRYVAASRVFDDSWADKAILDSEIHKPAGDPKDFKPRARYIKEPHNIYGERAVLIWFRSLKKTIPVSCSLVVVFLACHIAREAILATDILKWALEGNLSYLTAFVEIEKNMGRPTSACPLSSSFMFRPSQAVPLPNLESSAAALAQSIELDLPPANFYAIALRYLKMLAVPVEKILPHACRLSDWVMPPGLWLSENESRLPIPVCLMSILIVTVRILYNIHGFGIWEKSLSSEFSTSCSLRTDGAKQSSDSVKEKPKNIPNIQESDMDAQQVLKNLEAIYDKLDDAHEYSKDLPSYLKYCKDVVFSGQEPSNMDYNENKILEQLWGFYENEKDAEPSESIGMKESGSLNQKRSGDDNEGSTSNCVPKEKKKNRQEGKGNVLSSGQDLTETPKDIAIRHMKSNMEENEFCYISPRVNVKRSDYLHYVRKNDGGVFTYATHADYYILLRACAKLAQVDIRTMHSAVLSLEKRLAWIENRINESCLQVLRPPNVSSQAADSDCQV